MMLLDGVADSVGGVNVCGDGFVPPVCPSHVLLFAPPLQKCSGFATSVQRSAPRTNSHTE